MAMRIVLLAATLFAFCAPSSFAQAEDQMERCATLASAIHVGMTRAEIESRMVHDGGLSGDFDGERLFFTERSGQESCMLNIDFHPYGLANSIYVDANAFAQWVRTSAAHPNPKDVAVKVSAPFLAS